MDPAFALHRRYGSIPVTGILSKQRPGQCEHRGGAHQLQAANSLWLSAVLPGEMQTGHIFICARNLDPYFFTATSTLVSPAATVIV